MKKIIALLTSRITSITHVFGLLAIVVGAFLLIYDVRYLLSFGGDWDYINNIIVEAHGLFFDLLVLGVLISIYERVRQKKEAIEKEENLINDFRGWDEKESMYRIVGAVRRLNALGETALNLQGCFLQGANLINADFKGSNLKKVDLRLATLNLANFQQTEMEKSNLSEAILLGANFQFANLKKADLQRASLWNSNMQRATLHWANLKGASLDNANLKGAVLQWANLENASLKNSNLQEAILEYVNLKGAILEYVDFREANLYEAIVDSDWFEKLESWGVVGKEQIKGKYLIDENGVLKLR